VITVYTFQIVVFGVQKLAKKTKYIAKTRSLNNINKINNCINILFMINSKRKGKKFQLAYLQHILQFLEKYLQLLLIILT